MDDRCRLVGSVGILEREGYKAVMVTDTALFRYGAYHTPQDTPEKMVYHKMARVVSAMTRVVVEMASSV